MHHIINIKKGKYFQGLRANRLKSCKRMPLCLRGKKFHGISFQGIKLLHDKVLSASMTLEAALVLPLFLFAVLNLISIIDIYRVEGTNSAKLYKQVKKLAVESAFVDENEYIDLYDFYHIEPMFDIMGYNDFRGYSYMRTKVWNGYDVESAAANGDTTEQMVYVTENGTVYHTSISCTHIKLSIRNVDRDALLNLRNESGGKFYPCEICGDDGSDHVLITDTGDKYHSSIECSGLKRTVRAVPISEVGSLGVCERCGK